MAVVMRIDSFALSLRQKEANLECRLTRSPAKSMMMPIFNCELTKAVKKKITDSYGNVVRLARRSKTNVRTFEEKLGKMGRDIGKILQPILEHFDLLNREDGANLSLTLDKYTVRIPWELAIFDKSPQLFLCERMNIGRAIDIESKEGFYNALESKARGKMHRALVVGVNYRKCKRVRLPLDHAEKEARVVASTLRRFGKDSRLEVPQPLIGKKARKSTVEEQVRKGISVFHFSGHGKMKGRTGEIFLNCGEKLTTEELLEECIDARIPAPTLSFINACETALEKAGRWEVYNWARAMANQGGRACIGTFWSVKEKESTQFSVKFYEDFFLRKKILGESVRQARLEVKKKGKDTIFTWLAFVLYGPPTLRTSDILI